MKFLRGIRFSKQTDAELLGHFRKKNDLEILGILFNRYLEYIYGVCLKYLKEPNASKDAVMQIFEMLVKKVPQHDIQNFKSWLYVVSKNHCLEQIRKNKKTLSAPVSDLLMHSPEIIHHDKEFELIDDYAQLYACVHNLPVEQKKCIELFYFEGMSYQAIAEQMQQAKDRIRSYIQNGRRNLKICLDNQRGNEE